MKEKKLTITQYNHAAEEIGERDSEDIDERVVEQQINQNIKNFIMTFGHDFAFIGNQYHLEVYGV